MVRLVFHGSVYVQILRGRLALIIENFKAYFLALPQIGKAGLPHGREVNEHLRSTGVRFYESIAFCRINRLNGACCHHLGPRIVGMPDHNPEFAVQQSAAVRKTRGSRYRGSFPLGKTADCQTLVSLTLARVKCR